MISVYPVDVQSSNCIVPNKSWPYLNIKNVFSWYGEFHHNKTFSRPSYLYNGNSNTGKAMSSWVLGGLPKSPVCNLSLYLPSRIGVLSKRYGVCSTKRIDWKIIISTANLLKCLSSNRSRGIITTPKLLKKQDSLFLLGFTSGASFTNMV